MKVGDKVILKKFEDNNVISFIMEDEIGKEVEVIEVDDSDNTFLYRDGYWWMQNGCEILNK